jgi:DNA polymerase (family 10)
LLNIIFISERRGKQGYLPKKPARELKYIFSFANMTNQDIADIFDLLSKLMDIHGENSFKTKSYSSAAFRIEKLPQPLEQMAAEQINSISGIGEAITKKIIEIISLGKLPLLEEYIAKTPPGVIEMLSIKGIGPKKISLLWKELGLESIGELEYACNENRLVSLKGFGAKTQESILKSITFIHNNQGFFLWAEAEATADPVIKSLRLAYPGNLIAFTGDYRRQLPTLTAIAFLTDMGESQLRSFFASDPDTLFDTRGDALYVKKPNVPDLIFHFSPAGQFYSNLFATSAAPEFYDAFTGQYSLPEQAEKEESIFEQNGLPYIPAAMRETASALAAAAAGKIPVLIQPGDIKGIIHSHSTWSDGMHTLEQMATAARDKGYEYLVISDHSQAAFYANGLFPERIIQQHAEIDALNQKLAPFRIFKSIEADILHDGSLDYTPEVLSSFDLVIASVHSNIKMTEEKAMQRLLAAIRNPFTTILGHPTGRLLLSREGYPVDHKAMIDACVEHNVVVEINAHPRRLDLDWSWVSYALEKGAMLSVNPDAHSIDGMDLVKYGVYAAQKGGLTRERNLSSKSLAEIEDIIRIKKTGA